MNTKPGAWMLIYCPANKTFLLGKRSHRVSKPHMWNFFGGHLDPGESPEEGAIRELYEETGITITRHEINWIGEAAVPRVGYVRGLRELHYFLMVTEEEIEPKLDWEHSEYRWFKYSALPHAVNRPTAVALTIGMVQKAMQIVENRQPHSPLP